MRVKIYLCIALFMSAGLSVRISAETTTCVSPQKFSDQVRDQYFVDVQFLLLRPYLNQFSHRADLGFGSSIGWGKYLGSNQSLVIDAIYDVHAALGLTYRYLWHFSRPSLSFGPLLSYRARVAQLKPWDNYVSANESLPTSYYVAGVNLELPMGQNAVSMGLRFMGPNKSFAVLKIGFLIIGPFE